MISLQTKKFKISRFLPGIILMVLVVGTVFAQNQISPEKDFQFFINRAAKLSSLCDGALKENSYLDRLSKSENLSSSDTLRPIFRFWKLFTKFSRDIDSIARKYEVALINQHSSHIEQNFEPYLLGIVARLTQIVHVSQVMNFLENRPKLELLLNEANPEFDLQQNSLKDEVGRAITAENLAKLYRFRLSHYEKMISFYQNKLQFKPAMDTSGTMRQLVLSQKYVLDHLIKSVAGKPGWKILGRSIVTAGLDFILPAQKAVFTWVGDARIKNKDSRLVSRSQQKKLKSMLEPGDIILERQDWFLSNIFLPGFWPHGIIYLGDKKDMLNYFKDDAEVDRWCRKNGCRNFIELLRADFPTATKAYLSKNRHDKNDNVVIEAISDGVVFNSMEESCRADYLAALRPNLKKIDIAKAIHQAFKYFGREYDFRFSFDSEQTMVCTELVSKSYCMGNGKGLKLPYVERFGKFGINSDSIVETFERESGREDSQLKFVAFLMGIPAQGKAIFASEETLKKSYKWRGGLISSDVE